VRVLFLLVTAALLSGVAWFVTTANERDAGVVGPGPAPAKRAAANAPTGEQPASTGSAANDAATAPRIAAREQSGARGQLVHDGAPLPDVEVRALFSYGDTPVGEAMRTAADGSFAMNLPAGRYTLACRGAGVPRGFQWQTMELNAGQRAELGAIEVPAAATLAGFVVDEQEQPIADALVFVTGTGLPTIGAGVDDVAAVPDAVLVRTDAGGRFRLSGVRPGRCNVAVEHAHYFPTLREVQPSAGGLTDCGEFVLHTFTALRGFVVDERGEPVVGARVVPGGAREHSELQARRAVRTGANGAFTLPCFGSAGDLTVFADGCEPLPAECTSEDVAPVRLVVHPALALQGRVRADRPGRLNVSMLPDEYWRGAAWVKDVLYREHAIAADGTFRVAAVPKGRWLVTANVPGVGVSEPRLVEVPLTAPLELDLLAEVVVDVHVVDDLGAPVAAATVVRAPMDEVPKMNPFNHYSWFTWGTREQTTTDAQGHAVVRLPAGKPLLLAARTPQHLTAYSQAAAAEVPASVTLVLPRAAAIEGRLDDAGLGASVCFSIRCLMAKDRSSGGVDRDGRFRVAPLPPGRVRVGLIALDGTSSVGRMFPVPRPVPVLGDYESIVPEVEVELRAGETSTVILPAPAFGEIAGRVLLRGQPLANAIVCGRRPDDRGHAWAPMETDGHESLPHTRTDAEGRFRFLVARAGRWELLARSDRGSQWSPALTIECATGTDRRRADIALAAAAIRGICSLASIAPNDRQWVEAQLYRLDEADQDAFLSGDWSMSQAWRTPKQPLDRSGAFVFEGVPAGGWVLRIVQSGYWGQILWQQVVTTVSDEEHDLGAIVLPVRVPVRVRTGVANDIGAWLMQAAEGNERGVFVATIAGAVNGVFDLGTLAPGRYRLQPFRRGIAFVGDRGTRGEAHSEPAAIEVHADGRVSPEVVFADGVH
jgi:hypothetical protein